jgi:hypothetical protein
LKTPVLFFWSILLFSTLLTSGCRRQKGARGGAIRADSVAVRPLPPADSAGTPAPGEAPQVAVAEADFRYLVTRSRLSYQSSTGQRVDNALVNLKARKDSIIWLNVSVLGISGARALITQESITVLDLVRKTYSQSDYATLSRRYGMPVSFSLIQAILLGNLPLGTVPYQARREGNFWVLRQAVGPVRADSYVQPDDRRVRRFEAAQDLTNHTLRLLFGELTAVPGSPVALPFSTSLALTLQTALAGQPNQTTIELRHQRVELTDEPQTFPFSIPASYERTN